MEKGLRTLRAIFIRDSLGDSLMRCSGWHEYSRNPTITGNE
jgi:hypothetical protein